MHLLDTSPEHGENIDDIINEFIEDLNKADFVVAHNATFDMKMIKAEVMRLGRNDHMRVCPWLDTCYYGYQLCQGKQANGRAKYPTLSELYFKVKGKEPEKVHDAAADVSTLITGFYGLLTMPVEDKYHNVGPVLSETRIKLVIAKFKEKQDEQQKAE